MAAFSWRRIWLSFKDVAAVAQGWKKVVSRILALAALTGYVVAAAFAPKDLLPPSWWATLWLAALLVSAFTFGVQAVYRHRAALEDLRARGASLHASQRDRIEHVKQLAGRIQTSLSRLDLEDYSKVRAWIDELDEELGSLAEWSHSPATAFAALARSQLESILGAADRPGAVKRARKPLLWWRESFVMYWNGVLAAHLPKPPEDP